MWESVTWHMGLVCCVCFPKKNYGAFILHLCAVEGSEGAAIIHLEEYSGARGVQRR